MTKEIFTAIKAETETREIAYKFLDQFTPLEIADQVGREKLLAVIHDMSFFDIGLEGEGLIGARKGLLAEIKLGEYDTNVVRAVAIRSLCREIAQQMLKETKDYYRKRSRKAVQLGEYL